MESAKNDLGLMIRLQTIYDRITAAIQERNTAPPEVQQLQEDNLRRSEELEKLEVEVSRLEKELLEVRKKENEWKVELEHFHKQKSMVTNEREFTAVISEIDYAAKAIDECLTRRKELEAQLDALKADIEARRKARPEEEEAQREVVSAWESRKLELKDTVHNLAEQAAAIESQLKPKHRARFLRLLKSKRGTAIAAVIESSCSVCHFSVRPHLQQRVRRGEELITCEHCQRFLYLEEIHQLEEPSQEDS